MGLRCHTRVLGVPETGDSSLPELEASLRKGLLGCGQRWRCLSRGNRRWRGPVVGREERALERLGEGQRGCGASTLKQSGLLYTLFHSTFFIVVKEVEIAYMAINW